MANTFNSMTLVDGQWVSRQVDVYQVLAGTRQNEAPKLPDIEDTTSHVPEIGILSKTVLASPAFKRVLPARMLHEDRTNAVFVGDGAVQLKDFSETGRCTTIATKSDFESRILTAKIFGDSPRTLKSSSMENAITKNQSVRRDQVLPPELLVLTLSNLNVMFLWAIEKENRTLRFRHKSVNLPSGGKPSNRPGAFLAVDPKRRAIAVAAREERFILYQTKTMESWRKSMLRGSDSTPIEDERIVPLEGRVIHMEFLASDVEQDNFHVVLLFIIVHNSNTKITCFDWDCRQDLSTAAARTERVTLDFEDQFPSLLIPLPSNSEFLLVFDDHISLFKNVLSGVPERHKIALPLDKIKPLHPAQSQHMPTWVAWDRSQYAVQFTSDSLYIAREDGCVLTLVETQGECLNMSVQIWPCQIDLLFACLGTPNWDGLQSYSDILIAGGSTSDLFMCRTGSWQDGLYDPQKFDPRRIEIVGSVANWTPVTDLAIAQRAEHTRSSEVEQSLLIMANGKSPYGNVAELRYGIGAHVDDSFTGMSGCTSLNVLDHGIRVIEVDGQELQQDYAILVVSLPLESLIICIDRYQDQVYNAGGTNLWYGKEWNKAQVPGDNEIAEDDVVRNDETLFASLWSQAFSIQMTRQEARVLDRSNLRQVDVVTFQDPLLMAAASPSYGLIVVAFHRLGQACFEIITVSLEGRFSRREDLRFPLATNPTCIEILLVDGSPFVFIGTYDSKIMIFSLNNARHPSLVLESAMNDVISDQMGLLCEEVALLTSGGHQILVCGMRTGLLFSACLVWGDNGMTLSVWDVSKLGNTSVYVAKDQNHPSRAFVSCGTAFCYIRTSGDGSSVLKFDSICFYNNVTSHLTTSAITSICQISPLNCGNPAEPGSSELLFAVAGDRILFSNVDNAVNSTHQDRPIEPLVTSAAVPRKIPTTATPNKICYLKQSHKMIVAISEPREVQTSSGRHRIMQSAIQLLRLEDNYSPDELLVNQEAEGRPRNRLLIAEFELKHCEKVYSIIEWPFVDHEDKKYSLIIVGSGIKLAAGREVGRRLIFNTGKGVTRLQLQKKSVYDFPVYSLALWSNNSLLSGIGRTLYIETLDSNVGKWEIRGKQDLPSIALHVSVQQPYLYVSTLQHSHMCYHAQSSADHGGKYVFSLAFSDSRQRSCTHHIVQDLPSTPVMKDGEMNRVVIVSDKKSASLTGLFHPPQRRIKNAAPPLFEACLPRTVARLQRGNIRPPWRRTLDDAPLSGIIANDIIGVCTDGTVYTFFILNQPARRLLRLMQNLVNIKRAQGNSSKCILVKHSNSETADTLMSGTEESQSQKIKSMDVDPRNLDRGPYAPRLNHIDGDLLTRWFDEDGNLESLVCVNADKDVRGLFIELALDMERKWVQSKETEWEDVLRGWRKWAGNLLQPLL